MHDDSDFMREGGVVGQAVRNRGRQNMAVSIFVLQAFAIQGGAASGTPEQEATRTHVTRRPSEIANALQTKHRVEDIKRNHHSVVC